MWIIKRRFEESLQRVQLLWRDNDLRRIREFDDDLAGHIFLAFGEQISEGMNRAVKERAYFKCVFVHTTDYTPPATRESSHLSFLLRW